MCVWAERGNYEALDRLLALGADPNVGDSNGFTALHHACLGGEVEIVKMLLRRGGDPLQRDKVHKGMAIGFTCAGSQHRPSQVQTQYLEIVKILAEIPGALDTWAWGSPEVEAELLRLGCAPRPTA